MPLWQTATAVCRQAIILLQARAQSIPVVIGDVVPLVLVVYGGEIEWGRGMVVMVIVGQMEWHPKGKCHDRQQGHSR